VKVSPDALQMRRRDAAVSSSQTSVGEATQTDSSLIAALGRLEASSGGSLAYPMLIHGHGQAGRRWRRLPAAGGEQQGSQGPFHGDNLRTPFAVDYAEMDERREIPSTRIPPG
jgi:hypothetical protein